MTVDRFLCCTFFNQQPKRRKPARAPCDGTASLGKACPSCLALPHGRVNLKAINQHVHLSGGPLAHLFLLVSLKGRAMQAQTRA